MPHTPTRFLATLWLLALLTWVLVGDRFLDWAYTMPALGGLDEPVLSVLERLERWRTQLISFDLFGNLRLGIHRVLGV